MPFQGGELELISFNRKWGWNHTNRIYRTLHTLFTLSICTCHTHERHDIRQRRGVCDGLAWCVTMVRSL